MKDRLTSQIGGQYHHRSAVNQLRAIAREQRAEATDICARIPDLLEDDLGAEPCEIGSVTDQLEDAQLMLEDARDVEKLTVLVARNQLRHAFNGFELLDTDLRDRVWIDAPAFVKLYEADPKTYWRTNRGRSPLANTHVPREVE